MATFFMVRPNLPIIPETKNPTSVGLYTLYQRLTKPLIF